MAEQQQQQQPTVLPSKIKSDVVEFVRLDDGLKTARKQSKEAREAMNECRERIIAYMREAEIERLGLKKGQQYLELCEKELKVRATAECVKAKLKELIERNVTDPEIIFKEISSCGGTKKEWKLARRTKRGTGDSSKQPKKKQKKTE